MECKFILVVRVLIFFVLLCFGRFLQGQGNIEVFYSFNGCDGADDAGFAPPAIIDGQPDCECSIAGNGFLLDGNNDRILFPDTLSDLFTDDFTIGFYFTLDNSEGMVDLLSYRTTCNKDSSLAITYTPITNAIRVEFAQDITEIFELSGNLDLNKCWHQVYVTKFNLEYTLYIDGRLVDSKQVDSDVPFGKNAKIAFSNSPCLAFTQDRLSGIIDEIEFLNYALSPVNVIDGYLFPERIINSNSTIFKGEQIQILTGPTCSTNITWTPANGVNDPTIKDPVITGDITTDYAVEFNNGNCISRDSIRIYVVDSDALSCGDLLLPNAFTPNNDGLNDLYGISNKFLVESLNSFEIYNRSGTLIYSSTNINEGWDGNFKGQATNPGMYLYKINYTCGGQEYLKVDNFSVIR